MLAPMQSHLTEWLDGLEFLSCFCRKKIQLPSLVEATDAQSALHQAGPTGVQMCFVGQMAVEIPDALSFEFLDL